MSTLRPDILVCRAAAKTNKRKLLNRKQNFLYLFSKRSSFFALTCRAGGETNKEENQEKKMRIIVDD